MAMTSEMRHERTEQGIHDAYLLSIWLKGAFALAETALGLMLLYTRSIVDFILELINNELIEDPNDFIATHFHNVFNPTPEAQVFGGLYLVSHGVVKLFLVAGLLRNKLWSYPASIAVFVLFILYQLVRFARTHSIWLLVLTVLDVIVIWLIWHEYRRVTRTQPQKP